MFHPPLPRGRSSQACQKIAHDHVENFGEPSAGVLPLLDVLKCQSPDSMKLFRIEDLMGDCISPVVQHFEPNLPSLDSSITGFDFRPEVDSESFEVINQIIPIRIAEVELSTLFHQFLNRRSYVRPSERGDEVDNTFIVQIAAKALEL